MVISRYECYIRYMITEPEGVARGQGYYISDIARVAGYNQYMSRKTKPLLMSDASPTFLSALWRR